MAILFFRGMHKAAKNSELRAGCSNLVHATLSTSESSLYNWVSPLISNYFDFAKTSKFRQRKFKFKTISIQFFISYRPALYFFLNRKNISQWAGVNHPPPLANFSDKIAFFTCSLIMYGFSQLCPRTDTEERHLLVFVLMCIRFTLEYQIYIYVLM